MSLGTTSSYLPRIKEARKNIWRNNGQNLSKFDEAINLHIQKAHWSPSEETLREKNYSNLHHKLFSLWEECP